MRISAQLVYLRHAVDTAHGAQRRTAFDTVILGLQMVGGVLLQRNTRMTRMLRAPVHETVLADVEVSRTGAALPVVGLSVGDAPIGSHLMRLNSRPSSALTINDIDRVVGCRRISSTQSPFVTGVAGWPKPLSTMSASVRRM